MEGVVGLEWKELTEWFRKLGLEEEKAKKLANKVKLDDYELVINPETATIGSGHQYFGSGGYKHTYGIWLPGNYKYIKDLEKARIIEILDKESYDNGFVSGTWYTIKVLRTPVIITHRRRDGIGEGRVFNAEVFVWY